MPDFSNLLVFSLGGGGGMCAGLPLPVNTIDFKSFEEGYLIGTCICLKGIDPTRPFKIKISQPGQPNGVDLLTPNLNLDSTTGHVQWEGYQDSTWLGGWWISEDELHISNFFLWSPVRLSPGSFRFSVIQNGTGFGGFDYDFQATVPPSIPSIKPFTRHTSELMPAEMWWGPLLLSDENGSVDVRGANFPANQPIYVLLYHRIAPQLYEDYQLVSKQVMQSDSNGSISGQFIGPFKPGEEYLIIGISNPSVPFLDDDSRLWDNAPYTHFYVGAAAPVSSCPGAILQHMIVNQRGSVCTKKDPVRLRDAPTRSGNVLVLLDPGSQFTVIGGPVCADDWSWWQIRADEGHSGWISEGAGDVDDPYYICPLP
jgi:hypothetical protein